MRVNINVIEILMFINCVQYCLLFIKCTTFIQLYLFFPFLTYVTVLKSVSELNSQ